MLICEKYIEFFCLNFTIDIIFVLQNMKKMMIIFLKYTLLSFFLLSFNNGIGLKEKKVNTTGINNEVVFSVSHDFVRFIKKSKGDLSLDKKANVVLSGISGIKLSNSLFFTVSLMDEIRSFENEKILELKRHKPFVLTKSDNRGSCLRHLIKNRTQTISFLLKSFSVKQYVKPNIIKQILFDIVDINFNNNKTIIGYYVFALRKILI